MIYSFLMPTCAHYPACPSLRAWMLLAAQAMGVLLGQCQLKAVSKLNAYSALFRLVTSRTSINDLLILRLVIHPTIWSMLIVLFSHTVRHIGAQVNPASPVVQGSPLLADPASPRATADLLAGLPNTRYHALPVRAHVTAFFPSQALCQT